jgi:chorismate synthase
MSGNTFGTLFRITTFGESHGLAVGGIIDGFPTGTKVDLDFIQSELNRRRPGQSFVTSPRDEQDQIVIASGLYKHKSTGAPVAFWILNRDHVSSEYEHLEDVLRPSHADYTYLQKYGIRDHRGGGRASARETASRVVGGAFAKILLNELGITVQAFVSSVGPIALETAYTGLDLAKTDLSPVRCPDETVAAQMEAYLKQIIHEKDTTGGIITCVIKNVPPGWGEPVFDKLQADLAKAMLSIPAAKGFDYGSGFGGTSLKGSEHNDKPVMDPQTGKVRMETNHSGGIQGGISNGEDIFFRVAFKPVSTIGVAQQTLNRQGQAITFKGAPRFDSCVAPRAVPVVEAMAALVLADFHLRQKCNDPSLYRP